jgi:predicted amidohydrolase
MPTWKIAGVQMDCRLGDKSANLAVIRQGLREGAGQGARLVFFPECALTGYCFDSAAEALPFAEMLPGPASEVLAADCAALGIWAIVGMLERGSRDGEFFNACAVLGPQGFVARYRKIHLPLMGVDRFAAPGDVPFAVHDLGGLRVGVAICYDGSFPETARTLTLLGADLVVLATNWPTGAASTVKYLVQARAFENHIYYAAVNRVGEERGFRFLGQSRVVACDGELMACAGEGPEVVYAELDPEVPRNKRWVKVPGKYELDRLADRRPEMYAPICAPRGPARR